MEVLFSLSIMKRLFLSLVFASCLFGISNAQSLPLRILEKPTPNLPKNYGTLDVEGTIRLRIEFLADGKIGQIQPISGLTSQLTELAVDAAKQIKFEPKIENGKAVMSFKQVEYFYSWRGFWKIPIRTDVQAEAVLQKAIKSLGGEKYTNVKTQVGRGRYSVIRDNVVVSSQTFTDVIVFPFKERTDFKGGGVRSVQTNTDETGWVYDGDQDLIKVQDAKQIGDFKRGMRTSLDNLLRGHWRGDAVLSYIGKRAATLGKRNEVVKLTYKDGLIVEFEFAADDGVPQKALYKRLNADNEEMKEEDRYAQFVETGGIKAPYVVDHFTNGAHTSRINYDTVEFNKSIPDSIFQKPSSPKEVKKDLKL